MSPFKLGVRIVAPLLALSTLLSACGGVLPARETVPAQNQPGTLAFGPEQRIGRQENNPAWPFLRLGPSGRLHMVWTEKDSSAPVASKSTPGAPQGQNSSGHAGGHDAASSYRAAFTAFTADAGKTWSQPIRVNQTPEIVQGDENEPKIVFGKENRLLAAWAIPNDKGDKMRANIRFAVQDENGNFGAPKTLNEVANTGRFPVMQTGPDNTVYIAWIDRRVDSPAPRQIYMTRISPTGTVMTSNYKIADDSCECCRLTMAFADDGKTVYVAYRQKPANNIRNIVIRKSTDGGATFGNPVVVSDDGWQISACPHTGAVMNTDAKGNVHVIWYTYGRKPEEAGIYYAVSKDGGGTFSPRKLIHAAGAPEVLRSYLAVGEQGDVYMAWMNIPQGKDQTQIFFRRLASDGETLSPVQQISQTDGSAIWPNVAVSADKVYVAWTETKGEASWVAMKTASLAR